VHGVCDEYLGAPNKNNGDSFLIIWRTQALQESLQSRMADLSIITFSRILSEVHQSPLLAGYREHPGLQNRLGSKCRVNLSFGLHSGWCIEGAVGSEFKINASYLSPNVNIAESLEHATRVYDVSFIVSETVVKMCTQAIASKCRLIDKVIIKGSRRPLEIHVIDLDVQVLEVASQGQKIPWTTRQRFKARQILELEKATKLSQEVQTVSLFDGCRAIAQMRKSFTVDFQQLFNMGYQNYSQGEWAVAARLLEHTHTMLGFKDGPSGALLSFMRTPYALEAPESWSGVHVLKG